MTDSDSVLAGVSGIIIEITRFLQKPEHRVWKDKTQQVVVLSTRPYTRSYSWLYAAVAVEIPGPLGSKIVSK